MSLCAWCKNTAADDGSPLKRCGWCRIFFYCSVQCQVATLPSPQTHLLNADCVSRSECGAEIPRAQFWQRAHWPAHRERCPPRSEPALTCGPEDLIEMKTRCRPPPPRPSRDGAAFATELASALLQPAGGTPGARRADGKPPVHGGGIHRPGAPRGLEEVLELPPPRDGRLLRVPIVYAPGLGERRRPLPGQLPRAPRRGRALWALGDRPAGRPPRCGRGGRHRKGAAPAPAPAPPPSPARAPARRRAAARAAARQTRAGALSAAAPLPPPSSPIPPY